MSGEVEVTETPNWLKELEAKREKRLKAKLGHEAGAGAPCLKCGDKCPGLDLHFWRKCCKICKCSKEEHEVQDDDIYGWAQFQLLGSKPNKIRRKILLPGKKDEIDLEWAPKGHNETIDKYLKTLPPDQLPVKGSQAAQDRKQLLQKQIPIHDIDPTLCHELTEDELKKMNEYIAHVKQASAGVGQIVSLSSIIKGKLHMLNPTEASILASRYAKGVPMSEIVQLQAHNKANALGQNLQNLSLKNRHLPQFTPSVVNQTEDVTNPLVSTKIHDKEYPLYSNDTDRNLPNAQFSSALIAKQIRNQKPVDPTIDQKYLRNPNFDPKNRPSNFVTPNAPYNTNLTKEPSLGTSPLEFNPENSAFVPYQKITSSSKPGDSLLENSSFRSPHYTKNLGPNRNHLEPSINHPNPDGDEQIYENVKNLKKSPASLPNYAPGKFNTFAEVQSPTKIPKNVKDLAFSTYEPGQMDPNEFKVGQYRQPGSYTDIPKNSNGFRPIEAGSYQTTPSYKSGQQQYENVTPNAALTASSLSNSGEPSRQNFQFEPINTNVFNSNSHPIGSNSQSSRELRSKRPDQKYGYPESRGLSSEDLAAHNAQFEAMNTNPYGSQSYQIPGIRSENSNSYNPAYLGDPNYQKYGHPERENEPRFEDLGGLNPNFADQIPRTEMIGIRPENSGSYNPANPAYLGDPNYQKYHPERGNEPRSGDTSGLNPNFADQLPRTDLTGIRPGSYNPAYLGDPNYQKYHPERGNEPRSGDTSALNPNFADQYPLTGTRPENSGNYNPAYLGDANYQKYHPERENEPRSDNLSGLSPNFADSNQTHGYGREGHVPSQKYGSGPNRSNKGLSEVHPSDLSVDEDFVNPSQVNIGLIQDINYPDIKTATHETEDFYEEFSPDSIKEILNNVILPDCHYCKKPFEENEFAVTIDRANVLFHAGCFKCAGCNQILADNVYFYNKETDNIYCLRDYAKIRGFPRCKACDELIFTKEYCLAENSTFHLKHFCCTECDKPLAGQDYTLDDEMPYCLPCFEQSKASKCNTCGKVIKPDEVGCNLKGIHFHAVDECFACKVCKRPLMGQKLLLRNNQLYCSHECFGADQ